MRKWASSLTGNSKFTHLLAPDDTLVLEEDEISDGCYFLVTIFLIVSGYPFSEKKSRAGNCLVWLVFEIDILANRAGFPK